jgi:hypothetical protein
MGINGNPSSEVDYPACEAVPDCLNDGTMVLTLDAAVWGTSAGRWDVCPEHGRAAVAAQSSFGGVTLGPGAAPAPARMSTTTAMQPSGTQIAPSVPAAAGYAPDAVDKAVALAKRHKVITAIAAATLVVGIGGAASATGGGNSRPGTATVKSSSAAASTSHPSASPAAPAVNIANYVSATDCTKAADLLSTRQQKYATTATNAAAKDAYTALARVNRYNLTSGEDRVDTLGYDLDAVFAGALARARAVGTVDEGSATDDAVAKCNLTTLNKQAQKAAAKADTTVDRVVDLASNIPWYPKGYAPLADGLAMKWVAHPDCDYLRCMQMQVMLDKPCNNLYVELSTENAAGEKNGFTNDILTGLSTGDRGLMTFHVTDDQRRGSVSKVTCY